MGTAREDQMARMHEMLRAPLSPHEQDLLNYIEGVTGKRYVFGREVAGWHSSGSNLRTNDQEDTMGRKKVDNIVACTDNVPLQHTHNHEQNDDEYGEFLASFQKAIDAVEGPVFTTDASRLWETFLWYLPADKRQYYTCRTCSRFVETYGGLVTIDEYGNAVPVFWGEESQVSIFTDSAVMCRANVKRANVNGVFKTSEQTWGQPHTGVWPHMACNSVNSRALCMWRNENAKLLTAEQKMAELREDYRMLQRGLAEFSGQTFATAVTWLGDGRLYRSEKCEGVAKWLYELGCKKLTGRTQTMRDNIVWRAVATAPAGYCHVRSGMIGTLLEDIEAGLAFEAIKRRFDEKMNPLQYMRPTAAPKAGQIAQAEKVVAALESAGALNRRFATERDVQEFLWLPRPPMNETAQSGVFGHLKQKPAPSAPSNGGTMTWEKFKRTVLPDAARIEYSVPYATVPGITLVTAVNPTSPPILQWDSEERRNPVSWYVYSGGRSPTIWGLTCGEWVNVKFITRLPCRWHDWKGDHQGDGAILALEGMWDAGGGRSGGLFPECLKSEYHAIRSTIEAYTRGAAVTGHDRNMVCGIDLRAGAGQTWQHKLRVTNRNGVVSLYTLDRWD